MLEVVVALLQSMLFRPFAREDYFEQEHCCHTSAKVVLNKSAYQMRGTVPGRDLDLRQHKT